MPTVAYPLDTRNSSLDSKTKYELPSPSVLLLPEVGLPEFTGDGGNAITYDKSGSFLSSRWFCTFLPPYFSPHLQQELRQHEQEQKGYFPFGPRVITKLSDI